MKKATYSILWVSLFMWCHTTDAQMQPVVGIDFDISSSRSIPDNWVKFVGMNWQKKTNIPLDDGTSTDIDVLITDNDLTNNITYNMPHASGEDSPQHIQELAETLGGSSMCREAVTVVWSDLKPGVEYDIYVFASNVVNGPTSQTVTITGSGVDDPAPYTQMVSAALQVNDVTSSALPLSTFAKVTKASSEGTITILIDGPGSVWLSGLAISETIRPCFSDVVISAVSLPAVEAANSITVGVEVERPTYLKAPEVFLNPGFCLSSSTLFEVSSVGCE